MGYIKGFIVGTLFGLAIGTSLNDPRVHRSVERLSDATRRKAQPVRDAVAGNADQMADHIFESVAETIDRTDRSASDAVVVS